MGDAVTVGGNFDNVPRARAKHSADEALSASAGQRSSRAREAYGRRVFSVPVRARERWTDLGDFGFPLSGVVGASDRAWRMISAPAIRRRIDANSQG